MRQPVRTSCLVMPTDFSQVREWVYLSHQGGSECSWWEEKWESRYLFVAESLFRGCSVMCTGELWCFVRTRH